MRLPSREGRPPPLIRNRSRANRTDTSRINNSVSSRINNSVSSGTTTTATTTTTDIDSNEDYDNDNDNGNGNGKDGNRRDDGKGRGKTETSKLASYSIGTCKAVQFFRVHQVPDAITRLAYTSLAELYQYYVREYVQASPIIAACGCQIHCYEHHFVHMVKLSVPGQDRLFFPEEKPKILALAKGFGNYEHEERRAVRLVASLEVLRNPDMVVRTPHLKTGDRAFIKEFADSQYPYIVVVVHKDGNLLVLTTSQPTRRRNLKEWLKGEKLFPKTPQPPAGVAV